MSESRPTRIDEHGEVQRLLADERPEPRSAFRARLRRSLLDDLAIATPPRLRLRVTAYAGSSAALLAVAALGVGGVGPLAP